MTSGKTASSAATPARCAANWLPPSPDTGRTAALIEFPWSMILRKAGTGGGGGNSANTGTRAGPANAGRWIAVRLDDRTAGDDDLLFNAALQPAGSGHGEL